MLKFLSLFSCWLLLSSGISQAPPIRSASPASLCRDCPQQVLRFDPYEVPSFFAVRFLVGSSVFAPVGPLAECTRGDCQLSKQLRFGAIYLAEGNHNEGLSRYPHPIVCKRGKETMVVYIRPSSGWVNSLYDSIPFRPGRYELLQLPDNTIVTSPLRMPDGTTMTSYPREEDIGFAAYFRQHEADLSQANPFTGCRFDDRYKPSAGRNPADYVPTTPADIFRLLLVHKHYLSITHWKLRPLTGKEQRLLDETSQTH
ncbi:hypothetical protein ACFQ48_08915 [Hymenobacter caeli]|uniref:DUF4384 domain-containing protein n=1 Tax=Hymenobacter caeli TaxID=2735894 RepID=A0ABX2FPB2_9BACT|nr:hypothetical protein [Hymenobacter caeli]NRT19020.1 hypothetical protein [Hymenobacter caeli]